MISQFFSVIINNFPPSSSTLHRILRSSKFLGIGQLFSDLGLASSVLIDPVSISSRHQPVKIHTRWRSPQTPKPNSNHHDIDIFSKFVLNIGKTYKFLVKLDENSKDERAQGKIIAQEIQIQEDITINIDDDDSVLDLPKKKIKVEKD
ncbi:uncharacterized protein A4U43_C03F29480 [Asparagus officinalis]|uniref:Uncharacterized protein n=1 Tax=Asparagus officinalis TaxID=4686 RepID=A0A5P1FET1_ASPOF|nr:uncharacterized protein A4U43_C03F29480 [Asparagus officinalis]